MKPFLFLTTRDDDAAALADYGAFLLHTGLSEAELELFRLDLKPLPNIRLDDYAGIILGGSPLNVSDEDKSENQQRIEADLARLVHEVLAVDFPFFGACFGIGVLGQVLGARVDGTYAEPVSAPEIELTAEGAADPLLEHVEGSFRAYVGHKESLASTPEGATILAGSSTCPIQMFRVHENVYATQFHPELNGDLLTERVHRYLHHGYIDPDAAEDILTELRGVDVDPSHEVLAAFVRRYRSHGAE